MYLCDGCMVKAVEEKRALPLWEVNRGIEYHRWPWRETECAECGKVENCSWNPTAKLKAAAVK